MKIPNLAQDCISIRTILGISQKELSELLSVSFAQINRIENGSDEVSDETIESLYSLAYSNMERPIRLNKIKTQMALDQNANVVFHGCRNEIKSPINPQLSRDKLDFGKGFYCGQSLKQAATFVSDYPRSLVYLYAEPGLDNLKTLKMQVEEDWMLAISYFRGQLQRYSTHPRILKLIKQVEEADVIIAPIADNTMYRTMDQFARGDITTIQAMYALSASELGLQHVYKSQKGCSGLKQIDVLYLCKMERGDYLKERKSSQQIAQDKVKLAKELYRRQGLYVEELLK